ncbi:hypothetical protein PR048_031980, partial [Dryococelus australis]
MVWVKELPELNNVMSKIYNLFKNTRKRRHLYATFVEEKHRQECPLFLLSFVARWNSWFNNVFYVANYIQDIVEEHPKGLVDLVKKLEGSNYPTANTLYKDLQKHKRKLEKPHT